MNTDARRAASSAYHAKRKAEGLKKVTLWLSPEARFKLDAFKAAAGSKDKAADAAILAWDGPSPYGVSPLLGPIERLSKTLKSDPAAVRRSSAKLGEKLASVQVGPTKTKAGGRLKGSKK